MEVGMALTLSGAERPGGKPMKPTSRFHAWLEEQVNASVRSPCQLSMKISTWIQPRAPSIAVGRALPPAVGKRAASGLFFPQSLKAVTALQAGTRFVTA